MGSISNVQSILNTALQSSSVPRNRTASTGITSAHSALQTDTNQVSPFARLMSSLQQLQQSNPTRYKQVTQQIATNLQAAAQTAQSEGNSTASKQLSRLATDFTNASASGQLPNVQDLAQAIGGGGSHHHHHHGHAASSDSSTDSSSGTASSPNVVNPQILQIMNAMNGQGVQSDN